METAELILIQAQLWRHEYRLESWKASSVKRQSNVLSIYFVAYIIAADWTLWRHYWMKIEKSFS